MMSLMVNRINLDCCGKYLYVQSLLYDWLLRCMWRVRTLPEKLKFLCSAPNLAVCEYRFKAPTIQEEITKCGMRIKQINNGFCRDPSCGPSVANLKEMSKASTRDHNRTHIRTPLRAPLDNPGGPGDDVRFQRVSVSGIHVTGVRTFNPVPQQSSF